MNYEINILPSVMEESIKKREEEEKEAARQRSYGNNSKISSRLWLGDPPAGILKRREYEKYHKPEVIEKEWASEKERLNKELEEISIQADKECQEYLERFEELTEQKSASFAGSDLTKEVVGWLADKLEEKIDATDRREHVEKLSSQISFEVADNNISCAYGVYDFVVKRCQNLSTGVEQAALARAVALGLQSRIVADYPRDASGTAVTVDIEYRFTKSTAVACVLYKALNGNYRPVKSWEEKTAAQTGQERLPTSDQALLDTEDAAGTATESDALVEDYMTQFEKTVFS